MTPAIVVIGDANVDLVIRLPDTAAGSRDLTRSEPQLFGGGTAANTAVGLARLGNRVQFVGSVGDDGFGRWIAADLMSEGIDTRGLVMLKDAFTPQVIALIQPDGERHLVVFPPRGGADQQLEIAHLDPGMIQHAAWLHTSGMVLRHAPARDTILHTMRLARAAKIPTSIDLNLRIELWGYDDAINATIEAAISLADVVFGSGDEEIIPVAGGGTVEEAAHRLSAGQRTVVARLGKDGAFVIDVGGSLYRQPAPSVTVVDTLGAGDAFNAGFISAQVEQCTYVASLTHGMRVAAYKIAHGGARALPTRTDLDF